MTKPTAPSKSNKTISGKVPVANKRVGDESLANAEIASLHAELHGLVMMPAEDATIREQFRKRTMSATNAVGVANLEMLEDGTWDLRPGNSTGRVPRRHDFVEKFSQSCSATLERGSIQLESFLGLQAIFVPVLVTGCRPEVLLILTRDSDPRHAVFVAEIILDYFVLWLKQRNTTDNAWKLNSLAALIELVSAIEKTDDRREAAQTIANEFVRYLGCEHAAVGLTKGRKIRVEAIAGLSAGDTSSEIHKLNEAALNESWLRDEAAVWPASEEESSHLLLAHKQLAAESDLTSVVSAPLRTPDNEVVGTVLVGCKNLQDSGRLFNFIRAASPRIASAVEVVKRAEVSKFTKLCRSVQSGCKAVEGRIWLGVAAVLIGLLFVPMRYHVRCGCELNSKNRQFSVAPFNGIVETIHVQPGDMVKKGQLLASMDGQAIRFQLASVAADLAKAKKERDIELSNGDIPRSLVAELEAKSLSAENELLKFQQSQVEVRAPIDGIVLAEQFENAEGASITKGDVLFEVGSFDPLTIEVNIPAEEIAHVRVGMTTKVWVSGYESRPFKAQLTSVSPRSEMRDSRNVFVAQFEIQNDEGLFRPGMNGQVRIDTDAKTLGWNLFHKPWNFMVSRLTWW